MDSADGEGRETCCEVLLYWHEHIKPRPFSLFCMNTIESASSGDGKAELGIPDRNLRISLTAMNTCRVVFDQHVFPRLGSGTGR